MEALYEMVQAAPGWLHAHRWLVFTAFVVGSSGLTLAIVPVMALERRREARAARRKYRPER